MKIVFLLALILIQIFIKYTSIKTKLCSCSYFAGILESFYILSQESCYLRKNLRNLYFQTIYSEVLNCSKDVYFLIKLRSNTSRYRHNYTFII